ncbi:hypothetical protein OROHE_001122 [Orobanche hederae]
MKKSYFMLSMLIPSPHEPGNNIDVYLQPLVEELKLLWDVGIDTFDASRKENFQLRAALLWTISDLPHLANLSGWSTKGKYACPICLRRTNSEYLKNSHKSCYMSHRIFLPSDHPLRNDTHLFDGNEEHREAPSYPTSSKIFDEVKDFENKFGKLVGDQGFPYNWKKRSIFYELPYWESSDKSKDNINARLDLKDKGIRPELHPFVDENGKEWIPASCLELDKKEKLQFCKVLKSVKLEKIFPPSFFDLTVRVTMHLVTKAKLGGPVYYRWMYPRERYLCTLKSYVRNKGRPEGSIAEGLQIFSKSGYPLWKGEPIVLDKKTLEKAHRYVLFNCEEIKSKLDEHESIIRCKKHHSQEHDIRRTHSQEFSLWFCSQVLATDNNESTEAIQNDISCLAKGPVHTGKRYKGFIINGFRFHIRETERKRKTQNSGVEVSAATTRFTSKKDKRPISSELTYYGIVKDIIELYYSQDKRVVLFECDWVTKGRRLKQDTDGTTVSEDEQENYFYKQSSTNDMSDPVNAQPNHHRVQDWIDDEVQDWNAFPEDDLEMSKKNKENRAMKKMQHITGKRSFAQAYEMEMAK